MYLNKAFVYGNLTRDPELRALPSGAQVCSFSLATNRVYKDKDGSKKEQAEFHNIVAFGKQCELVAQYLRKGAAALVEGRIQNRSWEQDGQKKYRSEIVADRVQFGPRSGGSVAGAVPTSSTASKSAASSKDEADSADAIQYPEENINSEDIPF